MNGGTRCTGAASYAPREHGDRLPALSVLLHLEDGVELTASCVDALIERTAGTVDFETLIVDDATTDGTRRFLRSLSGDFRVLRTDAPVGFAGAARWAAGLARAPVLAFLSRGTVVQPGWLEPLLSRLDSNPGVGAVGPCVLRPDGRLDSAAGRLAVEGRPILPGRGHPRPADLEISLASSPDFLEGSCLLVRRDAFEAAGGFDPAYPEGVSRAADLCRAIAAGGWDLALEPSSSVVSGRSPDLEAGNRRFVAKWGPPSERRRPLSVAFYLPQFHPIPENDRSWGPGFTEWTNVCRAAPGFAGHEQPHLPADLGFYDLRVPETRSAQAELATAFGVDAFCYYHYWFEGRRPLGRPLDDVLHSGDPDFPFCLCWANEDWRANWDGRSGEVLLEQRYSEDDDLAHIRWLLEVFEDDRYLRVRGKPLMLVYRASALPDPARTIRLWREEARGGGVGELFLCRVESFVEDRGDPRPLGFDASVEFQPDWRVLRTLPASVQGDHSVFDYGQAVGAMLAKGEPSWPAFSCVTPRWDNTPRNPKGADVLHGSTPDLYGAWVSTVGERALAKGTEDPLVFVNAWNEWGEGAHLEPCQRWGRAYLAAHRDGMPHARRVSGDAGVQLCVSGMHNSGVGAVGSWLGRCGLVLEEAEEGTQASRRHSGATTSVDPAGASGVGRLNELAIRRVWPLSEGWKVTDDISCHLVGETKEAARELVRGRARAAPQWGWTDPRSTLLLESWADLIPSLRVLLVWRRCAEVVASLLTGALADAARLSEGLEQAVRIWMSYNHRALDYRRLYPTASVLLPWTAVAKGGSDIRRLLAERFEVDLGYQPPDRSFEDLTREGAPSVDLGPWSSDVEKIESELAELSDR